METVRVKIRGIAPLLMNKFKMPDEGEPEAAARRDKQYDPVEDANSALYREEGIGCYAPSTWIEAALREAGKEFKGKGRGSLKATVLSSVFIDPEKIPLGKDTFDEIDKRPAVIQRNRIIKSRPRFNQWELEFTVNFDENRIKKDVLKQMIAEAGATKGIGDYRPKFGRFEVVEFG